MFLLKKMKNIIPNTSNRTDFSFFQWIFIFSIKIDFSWMAAEKSRKSTVRTVSGHCPDSVRTVVFLASKFFFETFLIFKKNISQKTFNKPQKHFLMDSSTFLKFPLPRLIPKAWILACTARYFARFRYLENGCSSGLVRFSKNHKLTFWKKNVRLPWISGIVIHQSWS